MSALEELQFAKELLRDKPTWCKGAFAKDINGQAVDVQSGSACRFCLEGAIRRFTKKNFGNKSYPIIKSIVGGSIGGWNDMPEVTYEDVIRVLDMAIQEAKENEV